MSRDLLRFRRHEATKKNIETQNSIKIKAWFMRNYHMYPVIWWLLTYLRRYSNLGGDFNMLGFDMGCR